MLIEQPHTLSAFIDILRKYKKSSIILMFSDILWQIYNGSIKLSEADHAVLYAYGPRILLIAMATANNQRNKRLSFGEAITLAHLFLGIDEALQDKDFLEEETDALYKHILKRTELAQSNISREDVREILVHVSVARLARPQTVTKSSHIHELLRAYRIYEIWNERENNAILEKCLRGIFQIHPMHFFRTGIMLLAWANNVHPKGFLEVDVLAADEGLKNIFGVDSDSCRLAASRLNFEEGRLRPCLQNILKKNS